MEYTEGLCSDGAAILRDGQRITISEVLAELNQNAALRAELIEANDGIQALHEVNSIYQERLTESLKALERLRKCVFTYHTKANWRHQDCMIDGEIDIGKRLECIHLAVVAQREMFDEAGVN